jgi:hypothetical protein
MCASSQILSDAVRGANRRGLRLHTGENLAALPRVRNVIVWGQ